MGRALKIGCGCLLLVAVLCILSAWLAPRLIRRVLPNPEVAVEANPISIAGTCTREEVKSYLAETEPRLERLFAGIERFNQGSSSGDWSQLDTAALRAARDELAGRAVAECLRGIRDEEVALADSIMQNLAPLADGGTPTMEESLSALGGMLGAVPVHVARMEDARNRLEARFNITDATAAPTIGVAPLPTTSAP